MQLRVARLCLDCEEVHDRQQCPRCASESLAFLSLWVPSPERRSQPRELTPARPPEPPAKGHKVAYGLMGLALAGVAGLWWKGRQKIEAAAEGAGELK